MSEQNNPQTEPQLDENQIIALRREKLHNIRQQRIAYPNDFKRDSFAADLHAQYGEISKEELDPQAVPVKIAGRMMLKRQMGKASFATIQDVTGQIQLYLNNKGVSQEVLDDFNHWDLGDIVGAEGTLFKTNHGELTVRVSDIRLLSKSLRPLPDKHKGLSDQETKYRQRYVDLIANEESRNTFIKRSQIIQSVRNFMVNEHYLEVETPMMHPIPGGATAKPFVTHHNALDIPLYLRIAPELYLKRLVVGGLERVFEINRSFRNEGMSVRHNPEFTMIEFYEAFSDYERMMQMAEDIIRNASRTVNGTAKISYNGKEVDLEEGKKGRRSVVKYVSIPAEETALAMVYRTGEHLSSAIILENLTSINIGDTVSEPGRDLDNMSDDKPHVRNEPQDSHDTEHNQYNIHSNINKY